MTLEVNPPHTVQVTPMALVHEWLTDWGGSEDVTRLMLRAYPQARLFATIDFLSEANRSRLGAGEISTTFLQKAPFVRKRFWNYLPLTALAVETHDLRQAAVIVSNSHAFAKGVLTTAQQLHVSYVQSPMRYAWDLHHEYMADYGLTRGAKGMLARWMFHRLRLWDRQTANNVDLFLGNSHHVRQRIWRTYRRHAQVLYPPVAVQRFQAGTDRDDCYITVSRLVSYKRVGTIVEAFRAMPGKRLVVIGDGPEAAVIGQNCPPNVSLLGWQPDEAVARHLASARAFIFAALEDFGISPLEAQACGTPVLAYGAGGALETVVPPGRSRPPTGLFFGRQDAAAIVQEVQDFEAQEALFQPQACREWAETFSEERFQKEFTDIVERAQQAWERDPSNVEAAFFADA